MVGALIFWGVIGLGVFLGIVLLSMAKMTDQDCDRALLGEELATTPSPLYRPATETLSPASCGEARPQRDLRASAAP
jgi:hypothetical protein